jgi:hypothetical protein
MYEDLRKAAGDDPMPFTFDELLILARPLVMVVDHRNKTPETMEVLQNEWKAKCLVRNAAFCRSKEINRLKRKLEMLTVEPDDTTVQKIDLEIKITRLESETLEKHKQRKEKEMMKKEKVRQQKDVEDAAKTAKRDRKRAKKEEAKRMAKAERDRKRAEKEAEEEAKRVAKAATKTAEHDAKYTADVNATIVSMIVDGVPCSMIASKLGNGLKENDIRNRWHSKLKKSSGISKPAPVNNGPRSSITWTADVDEKITRMRADGISFTKIASKLGNGLKYSDVKNRWNRHLKDKLK